MQSLHARLRLFTWPLALVAFLTLAALACGPFGGPYEETFDSEGRWGTGSDADAEGSVSNGQYQLLVKSDLGLFWSTAGESFGDGVYQVEATQLEGPLDNGYGMVFRANPDSDDFYLFEVSGDGFVWIGRCSAGCEGEVVPLVGESWLESSAVRTGLNQTNTLQVRAEGGNMIFSVNGQEVGRVSDTTLSEGDIGLLVETLGEGGVRIGFDNFTVTPLE